ncbi:4Fe-4S dicluster domain-containing protein [Candidatus Micrarchaeota archaeon]|nr:4Fe-4S dicluster domain-containing protein [Candidatus Micrarchaeota archaeon]
MIAIDYQKCILCRNCYSVCPSGAIEVTDTRIRISPGKCVDCGLCVQNCPVHAITLHRKKR